jgi:hypothetical protein
LDMEEDEKEKEKDNKININTKKEEGKKWLILAKLFK